MHMTLRVLLYAVVAATSPLALALTLVVLRSGRGRLNGATFAVGFLLGQSIVCAVAFGLGLATVPNRNRNHPTLISVLELAFGVALLAASVHIRRTPPKPPGTSDSRMVRLKSRLSRLSPVTAFATGAVLGIGGPKRLAITVLTMSTIAGGGLSRAEALPLILLYLGIATVFVWVPVLLYVIFGHRAESALTEGETLLTKYQKPLTFYPSLVLGVVLVVAGLVELL
jgi:hypothetical protein